MAIRTALTDLLGIASPVLLAPMGFISWRPAGGSGEPGRWPGLPRRRLRRPGRLEEEARRVGGERVGIGFITWSLAGLPDLLDLALDHALLAAAPVRRHAAVRGADQSQGRARSASRCRP